MNTNEISVGTNISDFALEHFTINLSLTQQVLFYVFSAFALLSGIMVITAKNPVDSVLFLILVFINAAGLLILVGAEFLAIIFLVVYVGAIAVLFLFIVMMLNTKLKVFVTPSLTRYLPTGALIGTIFLASVFLLVDAQTDGGSTSFTIAVSNTAAANTIALQPEIFSTISGCNPESYTNIEAIGNVLYTYFAYPFIISGVILLLAMLGAIVLTLHRRTQDIKRQIIADQVYRDAEKSVSFVPNRS